MDQYIGKLLDNRYEILELVGTGGMAKVYKARCHRLNRLVAIKILREDLSQDAEFRRRFHDESQAVAMLSHPNIVAVYDVSRSSELEYIVMELIDGITLKQYMQKKGNKLNWREALHFITQITKALGHAHSRGIIHRDIKPHNVMVLRDGSVKVADFGIARVASGGHSTLTQEALGSVHYISPEQARGSHIDNRSDLYSAGVVLYEMLTGRLPFEGDTPVSVAIQHINSIPLSPRELEPSIPEALEAITMKAMAHNPDDRYLSADDMLADLEEFRKNPNINFNFTTEPVHEDDGLDEDRTHIRPLPTGGGGYPSYPSGERRRPEEYSQGGGRSYDYDDEPSYQRRRGGHRYEDEYVPSRRDDRYYEDEDDYPPRRGPVWPVMLAAVAVLLFVGLMGVFLWNTIFAKMLVPAETYPVPNLVGRIYDEIKDDTDLLGRFNVVVEETVTNEADPGTIIKQDPEGEKEVTEAVTEIKVTVSGGLETVMMPDISDMTYQEANRCLRDHGLKPVAPPEYANHDTIEEGKIISYTPHKDIEVPKNTEVNMVVSLGPKSEPVTMPELVGMTESLALSTIDMYKLKQGQIRQEYDDAVEAGKVVSQYPLFNTEVTEGTEVNLIISLGPDPSTQVVPPPFTPDPSGPTDVPNPGPPPTANVTKTVRIDLSKYDKTVNVRVLMDGSQVFGSDVDATMQDAVEFPVTGSGEKELAIYIDGIASGTKTVSFDEAVG